MKESRCRINIKDKVIINEKILLLIIIIIGVIIDQIVKFSIVKKLYNSSIIMINGVMSLTYLENTGGAFGIGSNNIIIIILLNIIIVTMITKFIISKENYLNINMLISLSLILSGGISNMIDRIFRGHVVDYIDINQIIKFPMFNLADIFIVVGCSILIILIIYNMVKARRIK